MVGRGAAEGEVGDAGGARRFAESFGGQRGFLRGGGGEERSAGFGARGEARGVVLDVGEPGAVGDTFRERDEEEDEDDSSVKWD